MIDIHQFSHETLLIAGFVAGAIPFGVPAGIFIASLVSSHRTATLRKDYKEQALTAAENLYASGRAVDLRDQTSARL